MMLTATISKLWAILATAVTWGHKNSIAPALKSYNALIWEKYSKIGTVFDGSTGGIERTVIKRI